MDFEPLNIDEQSAIENFWENEIYTREELMEKLREIFTRVPREEVVLMREAVANGKFDGRTYMDVDNKCGCFYGTLALIRGIGDDRIAQITEAMNEMYPNTDNVRAILSDFLDMPVVGCGDDIIEDFVWGITTNKNTFYDGDDLRSEIFLGMLDEYLAEVQ